MAQLMTRSAATRNPPASGWATGRATDLYYNMYRTYQPELGRYLTPDPIGLAGGLNLYGYAGQNPINYVDPLGLDGDKPSGLEDDGPSGSDDDRPWWDKLGGGYYYGTGFGEEAVDYYAGIVVDPNSRWWEKTPAYLGGLVAALWTEDTWMVTAGSVAAAGITQVCGLTTLGPRIYWKGGELVMKSSSGRYIFRLNPTGSWKSDNPFARRPHYHRYPRVKSHRPWERGW